MAIVTTKDAPARDSLFCTILMDTGHLLRVKGLQYQDGTDIYWDDASGFCVNTLATNKQYAVCHTCCSKYLSDNHTN